MQCRVFVRLGRQHKRFLEAWYGVGVAIGAALALAAMLMLCREAWAGLLDLVRCEHPCCRTWEGH